MVDILNFALISSSPRSPNHPTAGRRRRPVRRCPRHPVITTSLTSVLQAGRNQTVDIVLATLLLIGGVIGAQLGARASGRFRAEELRALLALLVLVVGLRMGADLFLRPDEAFIVMTGMGR